MELPPQEPGLIDNCYVEQKNYSVVRRAVGYSRYDTDQELEILNDLYSHLRLYTNFFQPVMKLKEKVRDGNKVKKRYDTPKTPYQRVIEAPHIPETVKERLKSQYIPLNPAELKRQITTLQDKLTHLASAKRKKERKEKINPLNYKIKNTFVYNSYEALTTGFV